MNEWFTELNNIAKQLSLFVYKTIKNNTDPRPEYTAVLTSIYNKKVRRLLDSRCKISLLRIPENYRELTPGNAISASH